MEKLSECYKHPVDNPVQNRADKGRLCDTSIPISVWLWLVEWLGIVQGLWQSSCKKGQPFGLCYEKILTRK